MSSSDLTTLPTPTHLTLLFKHHKSTTVLSIHPTQTLHSAKTTLLHVLASRNLTTLPGSATPLPSDPSALELGILADRRDPTKGFVYAEDRASIAQTVSSSKKKTGAKSNQGPIETFADLELRDGAWVAYRLRTRVEVDADADAVGDEAPEDMDVDVDVDVSGSLNQQWDVVVPSYDEEEQEAADGSADMGDDMDIPIPKPRNAVAR
ncbi:hypothetical protein LTR70_009354 [Exophiala xenobiotica]|uniref:Uncharacterized protein n=1 Tax=Lithohypha guttulata TaxID=1690604 RepID=A0ABR0K0K1_9EURO|nr:hypothetical protein LTR24_008286 [Lithohypha guttulata]KAK5310589.1 hypothetical protein LTR70_009354 [Exophiala xenobiotica]